MKGKLTNVVGSSGVQSFLASLLSIFCGLLVGLIIMFIFNPANAFAGFVDMITGGFSSMTYLGQVLYTATPLILLGLSVGFSFQTGVFNIGVGGQFTVGGLTAVLVGGLIDLPSSIHWLVAMLAAALVGMLWAVIPGVMKAYFKVNEIITCIMMNYVGMYLTNQLVKDLHYDRTLVASKYIKKSALMPKLGFDKIFEGSSVNSGLYIAIIVAIIIYIILYKTSFGYGLRSCGFNLDASKYAGINEKKNVMYVMLIAGLIAGLAGGILYLSALTKNLKIQETFLNETNYAIPIALLGTSHPIGVVFSGLFIAYITVGGTLMQGKGFPVETVNMITAVIIYFAAFSLVFKQALGKMSLALAHKAGMDNNANAEVKSSKGGEK